jgi:hypothetical protein
MSQLPPPPPSDPYQAPIAYMQPKPKGLAIASMVLGIISLVAVLFFCCTYLLNGIIVIPCGVLAIILGMIGRGQIKSGEAEGGGMATAGIVCGIVGVALWVLLLVMAIAGFAFLTSQMPNGPVLPTGPTGGMPGTPTAPATPAGQGTSGTSDTSDTGTQQSPTGPDANPGAIPTDSGTESPVDSDSSSTPEKVPEGETNGTPEPLANPDVNR